MTHRYSFFILAMAMFLATPAIAQVDYFTVADSTSLVDDGALADIEIGCMDAIELEVAQGGPEIVFGFYNNETGDIVAHFPSAPPGDRTEIIVTDAQLDGEFGGDVTACRAVEMLDNGFVAALAVGSTDYVYYWTFPSPLSYADLPGNTSSFRGGGQVLAEADGITGIATIQNLSSAASGGLDIAIYLAMVEFFGAAEDGFYELVPTPPPGSGGFPYSAAALYTNADLDLYDLVIPDLPDEAQPLGGFGLVSSSSEFGGTDLQNVVVSVLPDPNVQGDPLSVIFDPFNDVPIFTNGSDGGLEDVEFASFPAPGPQAYMFNNSFGATDGEQWGFTNDGVTGDRFAEETPMLADPGVTISGYDAPSGTHMVVTPSGALYVASVSAFGGEDAIIGMMNIPIPVELTTFEAITNGSTVTLNWATASETNNAGFEVQLQQGETWDVLGFVDGHGTTTEAQDYSFNVDLVPGTYSFRLKQIDYDGQFEYFGNVEATVGTPGTHMLSSVYPNPFNPRASFDLSVAQAQDVSVELYNVLGQRVATLFEGTLEAGATQTFTIDGSGLATGSYIVRVNGERFNETRRVTLLK